jgi:PAS domain S-box-containing protein
MQTLIVAEASSARARIERELRQRGHDVHVADEIDLAWHLWSEHRHPLVLVANRLRGETTLDFCRLLRRPPVDRVTLTLLIVPAVQDPQELHPFIDAGVDDWLTEDAPVLHTSLRLTLAERRVERVSERQRVREELGRALAWQEAIFEGSRDAVFISDEDARFTIVNAAACALTGYTKAELLQMRIPDLHDPMDLDAYNRYHARIMAGEEMVSEARILRKDKTTADAEFNNRCIVIAGTKYMHTVARDITELKRFEKQRLELEAQIQNVQKLESLGVLAGGIAHDFNNLLVGILGHASLALSDLPPELHVHDTVQQIEAAAMRAAELTTQLLTYAGKGKFVLERLDLSRLVADMGSLLASAVGRKVVLKLNLGEELPEVVAAPSELRQVVMNLVTNASEAIGSQPGRVALSTELVHADRALLASAHLDEKLPEGDYVSLKVEDSGAGMDESVRQRVFEPFFSTRFPGHGLGLAAVLGIVRAHRGAVRVESRPGRGTTVQVLLPSAPAS